MKSEQLEKGEYGSSIKNLSKEWSKLPQETRESYQVQAQFENSAREEISHMPLPSKGQVSERKAQEQQIGSKGLRKVSCKRLVKNFDCARSHPVWSFDGQMGDRNFSAHSTPPFLATYLVLYITIC